MEIRVRSQRKLKKFAANLRKQISGRVNRCGFDDTAEELTWTLSSVKLRMQNLKLKKQF